MIVADTNIVSELMRPRPDPAVVRWADAQAAEATFTTAVTVAEVLYGVERLPAGHRRTALLATALDVFGRFEDRVLAFDAAAAERYAAVVSGRDRSGQPIEGFDAQVAAICLGHGAVLATRNTWDFVDTGVDLVDPWAGTA